MVNLYENLKKYTIALRLNFKVLITPLLVFFYLMRQFILTQRESRTKPISWWIQAVEIICFTITIVRSSAWRYFWRRAVFKLKSLLALLWSYFILVVVLVVFINVAYTILIIWFAVHCALFEFLVFYYTSPTNFYFYFFYFFILEFLLIGVSAFGFAYFGYYGIFFLHLSSWLLLWLNLIFIYFFVGYENIYLYINIGSWFKINLNLNIFIEFFIDSLSLSYTLLTVTIALGVIGYTFSYFRYEPLVDRLITFISSFVISMVILVNSGNFIVLFLGWELIGLTSFLLINFWSTRVATLKSAFKAFSFNKISDLALLIAIILIYNEFYTCNINIFRLQLHQVNLNFFTLWGVTLNILEVISFFFIIAAFIKSAQFGFHLWLPDSMEAPVPASALIHSATLVSAGVFLFLRLNHLFELSFFSYSTIQLFGSITALYGGFCAAFQSDIKKLLAYSTISHCGFLMVCVSLESMELTILYLYIHGFFKATSFLCVGNIIRVSLNYQDFKRMGMFFKYLPFEFYILTLCLLNLSGFPFTIGFYSKHILFSNFQILSFFFWIVFLNCFFAALSGFVYCFRLIYNIFFDFKKGKKNLYKHMNNNNYYSIFYSNSSLLSATSILFLLFNCYVICGLVILLFLNTHYFTNSFSEFLIINIQNYALYFGNAAYFKNFKVFNLISVVLITLILLGKFKYNFFWFKTLNVLIIGSFLFFFILFFNFIK